MDVFGGEIRRRDLFPLLVLHLIEREPQYGNRLIEEIEGITEGVISANPNTIYPLLRQLEAEELIKGDWEHPDRRTRRYYSITAAGRREHARLRTELEPFLDSVIRSVTLIKRELYGASSAVARPRAAPPQQRRRAPCSRSTRFCFVRMTRLTNSGAAPPEPPRTSRRTLTTPTLRVGHGDCDRRAVGAVEPG